MPLPPVVLAAAVLGPIRLLKRVEQAYLAKAITAVRVFTTEQAVEVAVLAQSAQAQPATLAAQEAQA